VGIVGDGNLVEQTSADVRVQGIELEILAQVSENLSFSGYVSRLDSEYTRAPGGALNPQVGEQAKNAPPWSARLAAEYVMPRSTRGEFVLGAAYTYTDDYYVLVPNIPWYLLESRGLLDARVAYRDTTSGWEIELAGRNLTDELYALQATLLSGPMRYFSPGRTWSLQFRLLSR
jgi:iron complex outermembrane recepter protein